MPSFLIVHSQPPGGRADLFAQPPTIDVSGLGARLDWGDVTFEAPPGDLRVIVSVVLAAGCRESAAITVRVLPDTGTRISFTPSATPGVASVVRVDGQWPADAAMAYYAARDRRVLAPVAQPVRPAPPQPSVPAVGPTVGSTGSVPVVAPVSSTPTFGQVQSAVVEPGASRLRHGSGHQPVVRRDAYGRDLVDGDRSAPAIPTPREYEDFARAERERAAAATRRPQGWHPDPYARFDARWHDGERWTASVMRQGRREHDPV